ncbi:hypothetical protein TNCV_2596421 [Trichonephila clavipes]|nr:hypothetical protein TNCV_2596421 [Trichonephila clavipes]
MFSVTPLTLNHHAVPPLKNSRVSPLPSVVGVVRGLKRFPDQIPSWLNRRCFLGLLDCKNSHQTHIRTRLRCEGMTRVVFCILLVGMTATGWSMESGRRGYGASSG